MFKRLMSLYQVTLAIFILHPILSEAGLLYPKPSETRETISLDGIWNFVAAPSSDSEIGFRNEWYKTSLSRVDYEVHLMPVPSSYNDITQNPSIRDHLGIVWYDRTFFVPESWQDNRVWIRFSSVNYAAQVYINGEFVVSHELGHLPFQTEVTTFLLFGGENRVSVACDNRLTATTVPQGTISDVETDDGTVPRQSYTFDFFNYAGIHRPVTLYTTPNNYIDDITINTDVDSQDGTGYVDYDIEVIQADDDDINLSVTILDAEGSAVLTNTGTTGAFMIDSPNLWWPYLMDDNPAYLYTLQVEILSADGDLVDIYRQPFGIRTLTWTNTTFLINNKPLYLFGFGRHEDSDVRGRGLDLPTTVRDYNLLKWIGANAYRTSHYPYADEIMDLADQLGIMIIDECPGVNIEISFDTLLDNHKTSLTDLIARDKNRPSVIAWSIANEPSTNTAEIGDYFGQIADHVRSLDTSRPITLALTSFPSEDYAGQHLDIISFNRYYAWYHDPGQLDTIKINVAAEATAWFEKYNKPVMMTEYGADTMEGLHISPAYIWSEEYQVEFLSKHFEIFDELRQDFLIGEFIWNFADFKTAQTYTRVGGNKKGVFTRNRQPKASAFHLRRRYLQLANELYGIDLPDDLYDYTISNIARDEL